MKYKMIPVILTAAVTSVVTFFAASHFQNTTPYFGVSESSHKNIASYTGYTGNGPAGAGSVSFVNAAESSVKAVVHVKTLTNSRTVVANGNDMYSRMFGPQQYYIPQQQESGSGVVISPDGYIVTNNHVVDDADEVTVTFNDRSTTKAKVVGKDPATDIAVLKVESKKTLPYMEFGNSDDAHLGEWVLAIGYPLSLDATVTAGIISAKSRSIGINKSQSASAVESFIQTDAAVNPGNSGGALVNTDGKLIGINSAIASPTGSYAGYSYAIPSNIVRKAVNDLMKYGSVQRAIMGVEYVSNPDQLAKLGVEDISGVYVMKVQANSGAAKAGLTKGDIITAVNGQAVSNESEMQGQMARFQPGDNISVTYTRSGKSNTVNVQLTNLNYTTEIVKAGSSGKLLGATFRPLNESERGQYNIIGGVMLTDPGNGALAKQTQMKKGFVVTGVNDETIRSVSDLQRAMTGAGAVQIAGFYPGYQGMHYYTLNSQGEGGAN